MHQTLELPSITRSIGHLNLCQVSKPDGLMTGKVFAGQRIRQILGL